VGRARGDWFGAAAIAAILTVMISQVAFLVFGCDWDLCSDEAEFWAWSRQLDWSYYARGPLIAWLIRLATDTLSGLSLRLTGSLMPAVRLPAVILGGLTAWGIFRLASLTTVARRTGLFAVLLLPAIPIFAIGGVMITCDTPLVCCWTWAAVWTYRAIQRDDTRVWIIAGLIGALGVLAKYSLLAFPASVSVFLLLSPTHRRQLARSGFWVMSLLCAGLGLAPIFVWNAQHGWVGAGQLADRVGLSSRASWGSIGPVVAFLGGEAAALGGIWWLAGLAALASAFARLARARRGQMPGEKLGVGEGGGDDAAGLLYLLCLWGVIWLACLAASLLGEREVNWMVPGYISLIVLIGSRVDEVFARGGGKARCYVAAWSVCISLVIAIHHTEWFYPAVARWVPASTKRLPAPLRHYDPTARMRGHQALAQAVAERLAALQARGESPFILTPTYGLTSTLAFYLPGQPETYCLSWNFGMTQQPVNQHDLWHPNPRNEPEAFRRRPTIVVDDANLPPSFANHMFEKGVFGRLESIERFDVRDRGLVVGSWLIAICRDYRGIAGYVQNPLRR
jgi:4-amino-4-deoxy-L-arabinose transferase-like glycosyltransferase